METHKLIKVWNVRKGVNNRLTLRDLPWVDKPLVQTWVISTLLKLSEWKISLFLLNALPGILFQHFEWCFLYPEKAALCENALRFVLIRDDEENRMEYFSF